jgi:hypothetical protein
MGAFFVSQPPRKIMEITIQEEFELKKVVLVAPDVQICDLDGLSLALVGGGQGDISLG